MNLRKNEGAEAHKNVLRLGAKWKEVGAVCEGEELKSNEASEQGKK